MPPPNDSGFKYWPFVDKALRRKPPALNMTHERMDLLEMLNQDDDKKMTANMASLKYSHLVRSFMFVDRDELLYCPITNTSVSAQRSYQRGIINGYFSSGMHELLISRRNYASFIPGSAEVKSDRDVQGILAACLSRAYALRRMDKFWECYSQYTVFKSKVKSIFSADACPLHDLHRGCATCRCKSTSLRTNSRVECHLIHLSNFHIALGQERVALEMSKPHLPLIKLWKDSVSENQLP